MEALTKFTRESLQTKVDPQLRQILRREFEFSQGTSQMTRDELVDKILELKDAKQAEIDANSGINSDVVYTDLKGAEWKVDRIEQGLVYIYNVDGHKTNVSIPAFKSMFGAKSYQQFANQPKVDATATTAAQPQAEQVAEETVEDNDSPQVEQEQVEEVEQEQAEQIEEESAEQVEEEAEEPSVQQQIAEQVDAIAPSDEELAEEAAEQAQTTAPAQTAAPADTTPSKSDIVRSIIEKQAAAGEYTSGTVMKELKDVHGLEIHRSFCSTLITKFRKAQNA